MAERCCPPPRRNPPEIRARIAAVSTLLLVGAALLAGRSQRATSEVEDNPVIEVRGDVPAPGFYELSAPRLHAALEAAGGATVGVEDRELPALSRVLVSGQTVRVEPMDEALLFGAPVDLNAATAAALETVPGVGPQRAADIVADREARGPFASVDELDRVRGFGPSTVERLRPYLVVTPPR